MNTSKPMSFATDIRPMFTDVDVDHMKRAGLDLSSRDDVVASADRILSTVKSGAMPPPAEGRKWTKEMCATLEAWIAQGCPP